MSTMNSHINFDYKHEEDLLSVSEIKTESPDIKNIIKIEALEHDVDNETCPDLHPTDYMQSILEIPEKQERLNNYLENYEKKSQCELKNAEGEETKIISIMDDLRDTYRTGSQEQECDEHVPDYVGEKANLHNKSNYSFVGPNNPSTCTQTADKCFTCNICNESFCDKPDFVTHLYSHANAEPFTCDICSTSFCSKSNLIIHMRIHTNEKPFQCDVCCKTFTRKFNLVEHLRVHSNEKPFICNFCRKSFSRNCYLVKHLSTHSSEKQFKCNFCSKSFFRNSYLVAHTRTHTNERPFKCNVCNKSFFQRTTLTTHTHIHTKPFKCNKCNKSFSLEPSLVTHIRTHTNEKPFKCNLCLKTFLYKSNLYAHTCKNEKS